MRYFTGAGMTTTTIDDCFLNFVEIIPVPMRECKLLGIKINDDICRYCTFNYFHEDVYLLGKKKIEVTDCPYYNYFYN